VTWRALLHEIVDAILERVRRHRVLGEIYELIDGSVGDYARDHGPMYAGALAFYAALSLMPLMILFASVSGFALAGGDDAAIDASLRDVMVQIRKIIPYIEPRFEDDLRMVIKNRRSLGALGFGVLLISSSEVFRAVEFALARIFARLDHELPTDAKAQPRNYFKSKLWFGAFVTAAVLAFIAFRLLAGFARKVAEALALDRVAELLDGSNTTAVGIVVTSIGLVVGFVVMLKVFVHHEVHTRFALVGGALFCVLFQLAHVVYDVYLDKITNVGALYGSFATLIIIVLWIYFSATLLLLCCHVTKTIQRRVMHGPRWPKDRLALW
jgi:YihY family inner membrane protein